MMNSQIERFRRLIAYRDAYAGQSQAERRARQALVIERWAALPSQLDRDRYRKIAFQK